MANRKSLSETALIIVVACLLAPVGYAQSKRVKYQLTQFDNSGCKAKGRVQDCGGRVMQQILADGKSAIPILISQLIETTPTKEQIADYWADTRSGDVAFIVLTDLFTNADGNTFEMPGVPDWAVLMQGCTSTAQGCWNKYLRRYGRMSIENAWMRAWKSRKDQIYWDPTARCFRVSKN